MKRIKFEDLKPGDYIAGMYRRLGEDRDGFFKITHVENGKCKGRLLVGVSTGWREEPEQDFYHTSPTNLTILEEDEKIKFKL